MELPASPPAPLPALASASPAPASAPPAPASTSPAAASTELPSPAPHPPPELAGIVVHWRDEARLAELNAAWPRDDPRFELVVVDNSASAGGAMAATVQEGSGPHPMAASAPAERTDPDHPPT